MGILKEVEQALKAMDDAANLEKAEISRVVERITKEVKEADMKPYKQAVDEWVKLKESYKDKRDKDGKIQTEKLELKDLMKFADANARLEDAELAFASDAGAKMPSIRSGYVMAAVKKIMADADKSGITIEIPEAVRNIPRLGPLRLPFDIAAHPEQVAKVAVNVVNELNNDNPVEFIFKFMKDPQKTIGGFVLPPAAPKPNNGRGMK